MSAYFRNRGVQEDLQGRWSEPQFKRPKSSPVGDEGCNGPRTPTVGVISFANGVFTASLFREASAVEGSPRFRQSIQVSEFEAID